MKKLIAVFVAVATLGVYGFAAAHPDVTFVVSNSNNANVINTLGSLSTTGNNLITADQDVEDGEITTGNAETEGTVSNDINQNSAGMDVYAGSDVSVAISNENNATVNNTELLAAETGENEISADQDVGSGRITTGNAKATGKIGSVSGINLNVAELQIGDPASSCDDCTGVDDVSVSIENNNEANLENIVVPVGDTGENLITAEQDVGSCDSCGSGEATIDTGDAEANGEIENDVNQNQAQGGIYGSSDVMAVVTNGNDDLQSNTVTPVANSGTNEISATQDVSGSTITTGLAKTTLKIINRKNISITDFDF